MLWSKEAGWWDKKCISHPVLHTNNHNIPVIYKNQDFLLIHVYRGREVRTFCPVWSMAKAPISNAATRWEKLEKCFGVTWEGFSGEETFRLKLEGGKTASHANSMDEFTTQEVQKFSGSRRVTCFLKGSPCGWWRIIWDEYESDMEKLTLGIL